MRRASGPRLQNADRQFDEAIAGDGWLRPSGMRQVGSMPERIDQLEAGSPQIQRRQYATRWTPPEICRSTGRLRLSHSAIDRALERGPWHSLCDYEPAPGRLRRSP